MTDLLVKPRDAWWTVFVVDPLAAPLVAAAARARSMTPNRFTAASAVVALASAVAWVRAEAVAAALLFQLSFLFDCCDGKLARLRHAESATGAWIDSIADAFRMVVCYGSLAWWVAGRGDFTRATAVALAAYPVLHGAVLVTGAAWPRQAPRQDPVAVHASPLAMLRAAPRRMGAPVSTVDAEAVVFTLGPLIGAPIAGLWIGAAINLVHLVAGVGARTAQIARGDER